MSIRDNKRNNRFNFNAVLFSFGMFVGLLPSIAIAAPSGSKTDPEDPGKVLVCHLPSDDPTKAFTLHLSSSALSTHLTHHDDYDGQCRVPAELLCSPGYELETWKDKLNTIGTNIYDSKKDLLRLTASSNFTESTHPGIPGIRTTTSNGEVSETLTISYIDPLVNDVESFRVLVYDLDSETTSDQDYAYVTFAGLNVVASSVGINVEEHPSIVNAYRGIALSGGGTGADNAYHAGFEVKGLSDGSIITLSSGYSGTGSESFVAYQACVRTAASKCYAMADDAAKLYSFDLDISTPPTVVSTSMIMNGEGATYRATDNAIYTFNQPTEGTGEPSDLYKVDLDGTSTLIKADFMTEQGVGAEFVNYEDGTERLIVLLREWDSRIQIYDATDLANATPLNTIPLFFPNGSNARVDSLAINPATGEILVVDDSNDEFDYPEIYSVNISTGQLTLKVTLSVPGIDAESLAFAEDGKLYLENEGWFTPAEYDHRIFNVDLDTGDITAVEENINAVVSGDIEGMSCTGSKIITPLPTALTAASVSGVVFKDVNNNNILDNGEEVIPNISLWTQAVNPDGSIDPVKTSTNSSMFTKSNMQGDYQGVDSDNDPNKQSNYQINELADGDYQVHVDLEDADLPAGFAYSGTNDIPIIISGTNARGVNFPFHEVVCTAFTGEVSEVTLPLAGQLRTTDKMFVPSKDVSSTTGHLRAYSVDASGIPATSASWDAATLMDSTNREQKLHSTDSGGKIQPFKSINEISDSIKQYTFGSPLGGISRGNDLDLLTQKINISLYLKDTKYRDYYTGKVVSRDQMVLMSSDDGFLYAFDYTSGALVWAWMPRTLITELTGTDSYQSKHLMAGSVDILDLPDGSGKYDTYVVGAYKNGLGHFVLKLKDDGDLDKLIWDDDQSSFFTDSPNNGEMEFFRDRYGLVHATYVLANSVAPDTSQLKIRSMIDSTVDTSVNLNYQATSTPFVMPDFDKRNAPSKHTLYLGSSNGAIYSTAVLDADGDLNSATFIQAGLQSSSVTEMANAASHAVLFLDASISSKDNQYYLSSQSATRLTLHSYKSSDSSWNQAWTSYVSGAGSWATGSYAADNSGVPADKGGFAIIPPGGIQSLPANTTITARATIVGDSVVLPLTVLASSSTLCYGKAYFYLYSLSDGKFPKQSIVKTDGTEVVENIPLGYGEASQLSITDLAGTNKLLGYGVADKDVNFESGIATSFIIKDLFTTGVRGWKEIGH